jgi:hypothetical protein
MVNISQLEGLITENRKKKFLKLRIIANDSSVK